MRKRIFTIVLSAAAVAISANAASDDSCTRDTLVRVAARTHIDVTTVFEAPKGAAEAPSDTMEVLIARIGPDGKPVLACVDSAAAAKKFLEAPIERVSRGAKEQ
jgi:hypothetical protein